MPYALSRSDIASARRARGPARRNSAAAADADARNRRTAHRPLGWAGFQVWRGRVGDRGAIRGRAHRIWAAARAGGLRALAVWITEWRRDRSAAAARAHAHECRWSLGFRRL